MCVYIYILLFICFHLKAIEVFYFALFMLNVYLKFFLVLTVLVLRFRLLF